MEKKKISDLTTLLKILKEISEEGIKMEKEEKRKFYKNYDYSKKLIKEELLYFFERYIDPSDLPYYGIDEDLIYEANFETYS